jgi:hypothetical protein
LPSQHLFGSYGVKYEKVRLRKGYPRVGRDEQRRLEEEIKEEDFEFLAEVFESSANDTIDHINFLSEFQRAGFQSQTIQTRFLFVVMCLIRRLQSMERALRQATTEDICDNGYSRLSDEKTLETARALLKLAIEQWQTPESLWNSLMSEVLFYDAFSNFFDVPYLNASDLQKMLQSLLHR